VGSYPVTYCRAYDVCCGLDAAVWSSNIVLETLRDEDEYILVYWCRIGALDVD
jgi:hypothetical protein